MREELGLPLPERRVGLAAHDFTQAASAPEVVLAGARNPRGWATGSLVKRWWAVDWSYMVRPGGLLLLLAFVFALSGFCALRLLQERRGRDFPVGFLHEDFDLAFGFGKGLFAAARKLDALFKTLQGVVE